MNEELREWLDREMRDFEPVWKTLRSKSDWSGNEVMWLHYGLDYKYDLNFDMTTGLLNKFAVERTYDADWNS